VLLACHVTITQDGDADRVNYKKLSHVNYKKLSHLGLISHVSIDFGNVFKNLLILGHGVIKCTNTCLNSF
jgi:hypothetical protein